MRVAMISARKGQLAAFQAGLEQRSARVDCFADGWSFLQAAPSRDWELVILDGLRIPFRDFLERLLAINARLNTAVITDLDPQAFHEAGEGLGILCPLPARPAAGDVEALLERLAAVGGLDPAAEAAQRRLDTAKRLRHPHCVVCWDRHPFGLQVDYLATGEHQVEGTFGCGKSTEGFENVVHGGIVSSLLDGAMASCVLAMGLQAYTVELRVRFRAAVATGVPATIRGEWLRAAGPVHLLHATLEQGGLLRASARAKFLEGTLAQPGPPLQPGPGLRHLLSQARKRLI